MISYSVIKIIIEYWKEMRESNYLTDICVGVGMSILLIMGSPMMLFTDVILLPIELIILIIWKARNR